MNENKTESGVIKIEKYESEGCKDIYTEIYSTNNNHTLLQYEEFVEKFKEHHYFIPCDIDFVKYFLPELVKITNEIETDSLFYRARINYSNPYIAFVDNDLKAPSACLVNHGRLNVKGIPYLYISESYETSVLETRPNTGDKVGIGLCKPVDKLTVVDLTKKINISKSKVNDYRRLLNYLFSKPVNARESEIEYRPMQYIAEFFKSNGVDGVRYDSAIKPGRKNICLFNPESMTINYHKTVVVGEITAEMNEVE